MKIKQGDVVEVISGSYTGKQGRVLKVIRDKDRLVVEGINMLKKHMRPDQENPQGSIIEKEGSIHISNVKFINGGKATRIGYKFLDDGKKLWLVDWEYSGFNDPMFDLGGLASNNNFQEKDEILLLEEWYLCLLPCGQ